ncbi:MAG TPA: hypothetical protein VF614_02735 [Chthoniobacteraceae bacterium]|jgi:hypothetical protein
MFPQARQIVAGEGKDLWSNAVKDFAFDQLTYDPRNGMLICPGTAKHFDGSLLKVKFYFIPMKSDTVVLFASAGTSGTDTVFEEVEAAFARQAIAPDRVVTDEWWKRFQAALRKQKPAIPQQQ